MSFLSSLGNFINDKFGIGENTTNSVDIIGDKTEYRTYLEDGFISNLRPRTRTMLFQQPDIYVLVKKKMFSSLVNNSRLDVLEEKERLLIQASKKLFQNKCKLISAYEKLTKIEKVVLDTGEFNTFIGGSVLNLLDSLDTIGLGETFGINDDTKSAINTLRKVMSYSSPSQYTEWSTNNWDSVFSDTIGDGTGTIELTNVSSISTNISTEWGSGNAKLTLEDPYNILTITERDIDQAIADVTNVHREGSFFKFTRQELQTIINELQSELAIERRARNASNITFKVSPGTIISKRVRAIIDDEGKELVFQYSTGLQDALETEEDGILNTAFSSVSSVLSSGTVSISPEFLSGNDSSQISANNQLTKSERKKFVQIIQNIFTLLSQNELSKASLNKNMEGVNYVRNKMRFLFNGKYIIQPMDVVVIYMTTRTSEDERLPGGIDREGGTTVYQSFSNKFDSILKNFNNTMSDLRSSAPLNVPMSFEDVERLSIVGPHVPKWLWRQFKQDITKQPTGPCIFTGIVGTSMQGVTGNWSDGKWSVSVTCQDNTAYFSQGYVNFQPSADTINASIYDPLTVFDVSFDASTGVPLTDVGAGDIPPLLPENKYLLNSGLLTYESGPNKGVVATEANYKKSSNEIVFGAFNKVLHNPHGLVYRWKQGIQTLTWKSKAYPDSSIEEERSMLLTVQPFAGQDIMNVLSLLITGKPYNYDTFLKSAIANGNSLGVNDNGLNIPAASTYIQGLVSQLEKQNAIWGNFVPYKKLVMNPSLDGLITQTRLDLTINTNELKSLLTERAAIEDQLTILNSGKILDPNSFYYKNENGQTISATYLNTTLDESAALPLKNKLALLDEDISRLYSFVEQNQNNPDVGFSIYGTDINTNLTSVNDTNLTPGQQDKEALELRRNLSRYTARRFWKVKANEDVNLFIVDDQYDKNYDLLAFERKIGGNMKLFDGPYASVADQIQNVRKLLGLEVFANTQGHIEVRPPAYNKIPSTVFYKMFSDRAEKGIKVFPAFLETLYFNQTKGIINRIEILEDEIRLRAIALGAKNDEDIRKIISSGASGRAPTSSNDFDFLTTFEGGVQNINNLMTQTSPNSDIVSESLNSLSELVSQQVKISRLFTISSQTEAIYNYNVDVSPDTQITAFEVIRNKLQLKTGQTPKTLNDFFGNEKFKNQGSLEGIGSVSRIDRVNIFYQIGNLISERQTLLFSLSNAIRSLQDGLSINVPDTQNDGLFSGGLSRLGSPNNSEKIMKALLTPNLYRDTDIPQFLEHMIEYENDDDLGINSGKRFVISPDRIVSMTISENAPPYTMVTVNGKWEEGIIDPASSFRTALDGVNEGNLMSSATAVDYDMWYQYGFKAPTSIEAPFLSDPDSQCAPYAVATLLQSRENILQGSVQVTGYNEYYQPGDTVYIEERGLLFYVKSVSHSFSYGQLSTSLELTYGHNPGEYIPNMLDIVGKILYNAKGFTGMFRNERYEMNGSSKSLGALAFETTYSYINGDYASESITDGGAFVDYTDMLLTGKYGERNKNILTNTLFSTSGSLNQVGYRRQRTRIKLVYYKTSQLGEGAAAIMEGLANAVSDWLIYPQTKTESGLSVQMMSSDSTTRQKSYGVNKDDIIIEVVDISDPNNMTRMRIAPELEKTEPIVNKQGPSSAAIFVAKSLNSVEVRSEQFKNILASGVIDIFVDYEPVKSTTSQMDGSSEYGQAANSLISSARSISR